MLIREWLSVNLKSPHTMYDASILNRIHECGVSIVKDEGGTVVLGFKERTITIGLSTWDDEFDALKNRGLPFILIDQDHVGEPLRQIGYYIVNETQSKDLVKVGYGWLRTDRKSKETRFIDGNAIASAFCFLVLGEDPGSSYVGRGFAFQARIKALNEAEI